MPVSPHRYPARLSRPLALAIALILGAAGTAMADSGHAGPGATASSGTGAARVSAATLSSSGPARPSAAASSGSEPTRLDAAASSGSEPANPDAALDDVMRRYLQAQEGEDKTAATIALNQHLRTAPAFKPRPQEGLTLPVALVQALAADVAAPVPEGRRYGLIGIIILLDAPGRARMADAALTGLRQAQNESDRAFSRTALSAAARKTPELLASAILDASDERLLGDLAETARGIALPDGVRRKLDATGAASSSLAIRVQIAQSLGPDASGYDDVVRKVIADLKHASLEPERERLMVTLSRFPQRGDTVRPALIEAAGQATKPSRVAWRAIAQTGPEGIRYLATAIKSASSTDRLVDQAVMMASVAAETWPLPEDVTGEVIEASAAAWLRSDDPLLRSTVGWLLVRSGPAAVAPVRAALAGARSSEARSELAAVLGQLQP
ncbi:hypothetical protein [Bordetella genomosp. 5]|nr:hypothetical protein [Bordetella genomosp. 5]